MKSEPPKEHHFKKGQSPNPGGRPKDTLHLRQLAREHTRQAVETLVKIMTGRYPATARVQAANALLDRGYGKPQQYIEADLNIEALRVMAGSEFDARVIEAVSKLGRKPDGSPLAIEAPAAARVAPADSDTDDEMDGPSFREMMAELKEGLAPRRSAPPRHDPLDGFRDPDGSSSDPT